MQRGWLGEQVKQRRRKKKKAKKKKNHKNPRSL
jgi:hypothetical protein